jgi:WD40 repeat protein
VRATVARYAPSGYYIASCDVSGNVRIWDTTQPEHMLKYEYRPLSGAIKDIVWSPDSKRIVVAGEGRDKFGHAFMWDSGTSVGNIVGQTKNLNSVDFKSTRPFRVVTASEDRTLAFYHGPPFKFQFCMKNHTQFVNVVRYSPNGELICSGGHDCMAFLYNGESGEFIQSLGGEKTHNGGIYALAWSPDSKQVLTASGDKTCRLWDVETHSVVTEFKMGSDIVDQQVGCLWQEDNILSVSLSGNINYLDPANPDKPRRILKGHNKGILSAVHIPEKNRIYSGSYDGRIVHWDISGAEMDELSGPGQSSTLVQMGTLGDKLSYAAVDDCVRSISMETNEYSGDVAKVDSTPKAYATDGENIGVVATVTHVVLLRNGKVVFKADAPYDALCVAIHPNKTEVAVGGKDNKIHVYSIDNDTLVPKKEDTCLGEVSALAYSPDGAVLAAGDSLRYVLPLNSETLEAQHKDWTYHTARITALAWSPDCRHLASGSLDTNIFVWSLEKKSSRIKIQAAHPMAQITSLTWIDNNTLLSSGQDCCIRKFVITPE